MEFPTERTICFLLRNDEVLLALKKRGFGQGKYNGYGGKKDAGETIIQAAVRETEEESGLILNASALTLYALIDFYFPAKPAWNQQVSIYLVRDWNGEPKETEEMKPEWFPLSAIPYERMWKSDGIWLPYVLKGEKIRAIFHWKEDNETVDSYTITPVNHKP